jgi:hypothetical protein
MFVTTCEPALRHAAVNRRCWDEDKADRMPFYAQQIHRKCERRIALEAHEK